MKFRNPWIDPRIVQLRPEQARAYLLQRGWKSLGPAANPDLVLFEGPGDAAEGPTILLPLQTDQGALLQRMIDLVGELAQFEGRYAGHVLDDLLTQRREEGPNGPQAVPQNAAATS